MIQRKEFYISCDGIRLHCKLDLPGDEAGARFPLVLVIPGLTGHMEEPHIAAIAETLPRSGYASLRVELYGHGKSGGDFHDHTLFHWALELMEVIDYARKLDYVSELYLCGHSQGGTAAVLGAGLKPDALDGLILLAPAMALRRRDPALRKQAGSGSPFQNGRTRSFPIWERNRSGLSEFGACCNRRGRPLLRYTYRSGNHSYDPIPGSNQQIDNSQTQ